MQVYMSFWHEAYIKLHNAAKDVQKALFQIYLDTSDENTKAQIVKTMLRLEPFMPERMIK